MTSTSPLSGTVVVEIGHSVSVPYAGLILAQLGAEVIKVERPDGGDHARGWGPPLRDRASPLFHAINHQKRGIALDLSDRHSCEALRRLIVERADVVMQNLRPGSIEQLGLGGADLIRLKPSLIFCNLSAYGDVGPMAANPGYDALMQAYGGLMSVTGEAGRPAVRVGVSIIDFGSGMWSVMGILAALLERARSGKGGIVATSLYETALAWMGIHIAEFSVSGVDPGRHGSGAAQIAPYEMFETADGSLMVSAGNDALFAKLCRLIDHAEWSEDERFRTNPARIENRVELLAMLRQQFCALTTSRWQELLDGSGIPNAPVQTVSAVASNAQTAALGILQPVPGVDLTAVGLPIRFDGKRLTPCLPAPRLGEHTRQLLPL